MPPAYNLSQDQTLQFNTCTRLHSLLTSTKPSAYAESFVTSPMTVTAIRPASFSMSTSRDAYREVLMLKEAGLMAVTVIGPASFSMSTSRDAYRALESPAT